MHMQSLVFADGRWNAPLPTEQDSPNTLVLAFAAPEFESAPAPLAELALSFPQSVLAGCSTSGEIRGAEVHDTSVSVCVARFEHCQLQRAITAIEEAGDSFAAGQRLAAQLTSTPHQDLRAVFVLSDGLHVNGTGLVAGLSAGLPAGVSITGGLAGDGSRFGRTWVLDGGQPQTKQVCAVGIYGQRLRVGHGCGGGWSDFGPERRVTRAQGNVLFELDGKPALALYKEYLGERAAGLPGAALLFPLAVKREGVDQETLVRTVLAVDESAQSMTFAGDLPEGGVARLMRANMPKLIDAAGQAGRSACGELAADGAALVISVSCVGRRLVLGERTEEEVESVCESLPANAAHLGFYSYGEISPSVRGGASELHNQTMTVTCFSEA